MSHQGGEVWASPIPVISEIPAEWGATRPHVLVDATGANFDIVAGPKQAVQYQANGAVHVPRRINGHGAYVGEPISDGVIIDARDGADLPDAMDLEAAARWWQGEDILAMRRSSELAATFGGIALVDMAPKDFELTLDQYRFEVTAQGIVLATLRSMAQRVLDLRDRGEDPRPAARTAVAANA
jgi:hypothetical protein